MAVIRKKQWKFLLSQGHKRSMVRGWVNLSAYWLLQAMCKSTKMYEFHIWVKVFKNGPSEICGKQPSKNLK